MTTANAANYSDEAIAFILDAVMNGIEGEYTDKEGKAIPVKASVFNYDVARVLAEKLGRKPQSVVAKVKSLEAQAANEGQGAHDAIKEGAWYHKQPDYVSKTGKDVVRKADLLENIANQLDLPIETVQGSWNTKATIEKVYNAIADIIETLDEALVNVDEEDTDEEQSE
jgi:hypothetical protein